MKTRIPRPTALAVFATGVCLAATASGQTTTWYSDTTNNSALATGTAANNFVDLGANWKDTQLIQNIPNTNYGNSTSLQVNRDGTIANDVAIIMFGWDNLSITDTITSASLYFTLEGAAAAGVSNTWYVVGINGLQSAWTETGATWNNSNALIDQVNFATNNYGSFTYAGNGADYNNSNAWFSINVTTALSDYQSGSISGIAFINNASSGNANGTVQRLQLNSVEETNANLRPGMLVTTVPEPAAASLGLIGALGLLVRRRR